VVNLVLPRVYISPAVNRTSGELFGVSRVYPNIILPASRVARLNPDGRGWPLVDEPDDFLNVFLAPDLALFSQRHLLIRL
jgi:hypothetical protein